MTEKDDLAFLAKKASEASWMKNHTAINTSTNPKVVNVTYVDTTPTKYNFITYNKNNTTKEPAPVLMTDNMAIHQFDQPYNGKGDETDVFGGKGANLRRMTQKLKLPVPEGFTIPTYWTSSDRYPVYNSFKEHIKLLEERTGREFGGTERPLLVSVRSGAPKSMPGMMETILNVGLNDKTVEALAAETNETFAWDSYRRFIAMWTSVVWDLDAKEFQQRYDALVEFNGGESLDAEMLRTLVQNYKDFIRESGYGHVPSNPIDQAWYAAEAVFSSWDSEKAIAYRDIEGIPYDIGTACNVQRMVFGNLNDDSGTGVAFTRNPNTGQKMIFGDFLVNAQGEDVVAGTHATMAISDMKKVMPKQHTQLLKILTKLEKTYKDMCDVEFTVEDGNLYILQTRVGKRSGDAAVTMAFDMLDEGMIDRDEAIRRIKAIKTKPGAATSVKSNNVFNGTVIGSGLGAAGTKVVGKVVFSIQDAIDAKNNGEDVILVREETNPEDIAGMAASVGILTALGGLTSHAAVVSRGWDKTCVVGVAGLTISKTQFKLGGKIVKKGQEILIDGETGEVFA